MTIAQYPKFSPISIGIRNPMERILNAYEPFSDFNFTSLFCWDTDGSTGVSLINDNLLIKLPDYMTGDMIHSILGTNQIDSTMHELFKTMDCLQLVPQATIDSIIEPKKFIIEEDRDNFDYLYATEDLALLQGGDHKSKRNKINNFIKNYEQRLYIKHINFNDSGDLKDISSIFQSWSKERNRIHSDISNEQKAVSKLLKHAELLRLTGVLIYIDNQPVGFSINEIVNHEYLMCHFQKTILEHQNLDSFLTHLVAKDLVHFGCKYANWEQDLGIPGIRQLKTSYRHTKFLKKYYLKSSSTTV